LVAAWSNRRHGLYAAYKQPAARYSNGWMPAADYAVIVADIDPDGWGSIFHVTQGRVVGADFGCGQQPSMIAGQVEPERFLVPPP
jgi:hypothetical protein